jgi:hypothetical protein
MHWILDWKRALTCFIVAQDDDCEGDLVCFQRDENESVPGCFGDDSSRECLTQGCLDSIRDFN